MICMQDLKPNQLSCLGSLLGKIVAWRTEGRGFESRGSRFFFENNCDGRVGAANFSLKNDCFGELCCVALPFSPSLGVIVGPASPTNLSLVCDCSSVVVSFQTPVYGREF